MTYISNCSRFRSWEYLSVSISNPNNNLVAHVNNHESLSAFEPTTLVLIFKLSASFSLPLATPGMAGFEFCFAFATCCFLFLPSHCRRNASYLVYTLEYFLSVQAVLISKYSFSSSQPFNVPFAHANILRFPVPPFSVSGSCTTSFLRFFGWDALLLMAFQ